MHHVPVEKIQRKVGRFVRGCEVGHRICEPFDVVGLKPSHVSHRPGIPPVKASGYVAIGDRSVSDEQNIGVGRRKIRCLARVEVPVFNDKVFAFEDLEAPFVLELMVAHVF